MKNNVLQVKRVITVNFSLETKVGYSNQVHLDMLIVQVTSLFLGNSFVSWLIFPIYFKEYVYENVAINTFVKSKKYKSD